MSDGKNQLKQDREWRRKMHPNHFKEPTTELWAQDSIIITKLTPVESVPNHVIYIYLEMPPDKEESD